MSRVVAGRITHRHEGELVVFHIGMTVNQWWRPDQWMPIFGEMPRMLRELMTDPDSGLLGSHILLGASGPYLVQYWSSIEKLYAYASAPASEHRPAWSRFNRRARSAPKAVGVWHETFLVERAESIYVSTPAMGLPAATEVVPIGSRNQHARQRFADGRTGGTEAA
ncbi:hypothetical protein ASF83_14380 [Plantibacter sp. Leaf171]|uniref:DUF4188 domain-containing protein n=1 Tax=unclassified Plantibacter TaxID=2624265 RepID=UPI0006F42480|nr:MULTISPECIES: DUF4188 domain-containing protein [unclassified Plantibacter]KQM14006.1 hypothetical protein ASE44_14390 [Plantibacter sp. Leaf1]KQR57389.1 hypothetical protein ASF83_14380 [Plantibacter sp. Leaf171]